MIHSQVQYTWVKNTLERMDVNALWPLGDGRMALEKTILTLDVLRNAARALKYLMLLIEHDTGLPESAANGVLGPSGYPDEGVVMATKILGEAEQALDALPAWLLEEE